MRTVKLEEECESGVHTMDVECEEIRCRPAIVPHFEGCRTSPWLLPSVGAFGHFPKMDNGLDGGVYTFKTEPDGQISVSLVYIGSSRPAGGGN